ncbi:putative restriction endonuclease [Paraburkholderia sp. JPY465]|uniref:HNH endonuclease n=1 Tax=Paraburkholderia sp. JPY465 TaxID=3042285 RepID=UPI003D21A495
MAINIDEVEKEHVVEAAARWRAEPGYGGFGESTRYDILIEGRPYPPKAIAAIACECAGAPRPRPSDFTGAWNGRWHKALKALGFPIVPKVDAGAAAQSEAPTESAAQIEADLRAIEEHHADSPTTREALVKARLGQGRYRRELLARWEYRCAVTGCEVPQVVRASHAKPWRHCSDSERLDPDNGLPLVATLDALFDAGLITFDASGRMEISVHIDENQQALLLSDAPRALSKTPSKELAAYLAAHRQHVFKKSDDLGRRGNG